MELLSPRSKRRQSHLIMLARVILMSWVVREAYTVLSAWFEWQISGQEFSTSASTDWMTVPTFNETVSSSATKVQQSVSNDMVSVESSDVRKESKTIPIVEIQTEPSEGRSTKDDTTPVETARMQTKPMNDTDSKAAEPKVTTKDASPATTITPPTTNATQPKTGQATEKNDQPAKKSTPLQITKLDLVEQSIRHVEPPSNISVAVCFKTLFGDIDLGIVIQWAAYNRLLGFDHIYMWYRPEMTSVPRFDELQRLPYVTLTVNTEGKRKDYYVQWKSENWCLSQPQFAGKHDWAMVNDIDEYLWFPQHMGIKQFLAQQPSHYTYLSFPKRMYTLDHRTDMQAINHKIDMSSSTEFALQHYPFYLDHFCYAARKLLRGVPFCPTWRGRAKVIVRPSHHTRIDVHGNMGHPNPDDGHVHFNNSVARFMEWPEIFASHNVTKRDAVAFSVKEEGDVHIHNLIRGFKADEQGNIRLQHDDKLREWFDYVENRFMPGP